MESRRQLFQAFTGEAALSQEELRQTFSEGIADVINQAAENLQFSRNLFQLPDVYDHELAAIEQQLRDIAKRIDGVVLSIHQARAVQHLPQPGRVKRAA